MSTKKPAKKCGFFAKKIFYKLYKTMKIDKTSFFLNKISYNNLYKRSNTNFKGKVMHDNSDLKIIEEHIHGGFGVNFNTANEDDIKNFAKNIKKYGVVAFYPTLATDSADNLKKQINIIRNAKNNQKQDEAKILGVHLEACFLNPEKKGIHNEKNFMELTPDNFKKLEGDDIIKIVTLAPELDKGLVQYLKKQGIKIHAGHSMADNIEGIDGTTHHFNAMPKPSAKDFKNKFSYKALIDKDIYCEIIADFIHNDYETIKMFLETKPHDKIILVSDALPIAHSDKDYVEFCDKKIYKEGRDDKGCLAGSIMFLKDICENLIKKGVLKKEDIQNMIYNNPIKHLNIDEKDIYD